MRRAEFGVIGVGTIGAMALWQLAKRGCDVVGLEQFHPGHQRGAAAGDTRWVRTASEGHAYVPMVSRALELWRELEADSRQNLLDLCGGLYVGGPGGSLVRDSLQNCADHDLDHETLSAGEIRARFPHFVVNDDEVGVFERDAGYVQASLSVAAAASAAERLGARLHGHTEVTAVAPTARGIEVVAGGQTWLFDRVLVATGPWGRGLLPDHIPHLEIERFLVSWYPVEPRTHWGPDRVPILERQGEGLIFGSWPSVDGVSVKVGFAAPVDRLCRAEDMHQGYSASVVELTDAYVRQWLRGVIPTSVRHVAGMDAHTSDRDFLLGPTEADPRIVLALGQSGHGFKMSPATGAAAADYLQEGASHQDLGPFLPSRFPVLPYLDYRG